MTNAVDAALKELASVSHTLNEVSDQLSKHLIDVECALGGYNLGVNAWVELRKEKRVSEPDNSGLQYVSTHVEMLGYGKYKGKWGLFVANYCEETFDEGSTDQQLLRDAPRETRLAAVEKLPDLLTALTKEAAQVAGEAAKKAEEARQIAAGLGKKSR